MIAVRLLSMGTSICRQAASVIDTTELDSKTAHSRSDNLLTQPGLVWESGHVLLGHTYGDLDRCEGTSHCRDGGSHITRCWIFSSPPSIR